MINFPDSPTDGQVFTSADRTWIYNAAIPAWEGGNKLPTWNSIQGEANHIPMVITPIDVPTTEGTVSWNATDHTLNLQTEIAHVVQQVGQELLVPIKNNTGAILTDGTAVAITGSTGQRMTVEKAIASNAAHAKSTIGLITHDVAINGDGYCTIFGRTRELNTNGFDEGAAVYLSPTTAGLLTQTEPAAPNYRVRIGWIEKKSSGNGVILVNTERFSASTADIVDLTSGIATATHALTSKTILVDNDEVAIVDSAASYGAKKSLWSSIKSSLKSYFDGVYQATISYYDATRYKILTGTAAEARAEIMGPAGAEIAAAAAHTGTGSTRKLMGLDVTDSPIFNGLDVGTFGNIRAFTIKMYQDALVYADGGLNFRPPYGSARITIQSNSGESAINIPLLWVTSVALRPTSATLLEIDTGTAGTFADLKLRNLISTGSIQPATYTVATTPATAALGMVTGAIILVSDAEAPVVGSPVASGAGTDHLVICAYNGTNWIVAVILT